VTAPACELCAGPGGTVLWRDAQLRVIAVDDPDYPGMLRVVWNAHVREMSDLAPADAQHLLRAVLAAEAGVRAVLAPDKINLASLGNVVPHLHWHVIGRFGDDAHFPQSIWSTRQRTVDAAALDRRRALVPQLVAALQRALDELSSPAPAGEGPGVRDRH
jgi:diadenosine tetraphosphate (Ap4A) HIT family hydrolase